MAKRRKTRQEKMLADLRRKLAAQNELQQSTIAAPSYSLTQLKPRITTINVPRATSSYAYVLSDLKKTAFFATLAIAAQVVLFFVLLR